MAKSYHMSGAEFRRRGHALVDWIADYQERVENLPVLSQLKPGDVRAALPTEPPMAPESFDQIMEDIDKVILPGITHWQSPNFFAYFPCNGSGPGILGELLSAGLNVQGMLWATSPACTELETHVLDWVAQLLDLPEVFRSTGKGGGVIQDSASSATLVAMIAARERTIRDGKASLADVVVYTSAHAHSSIEKAARIAGISHVRKIATDAKFAMSSDALSEAIEADVRDSLAPSFISATLGTTSSLAFDPLATIGALAVDGNIWVHVDAAMAGTASICPEFRFEHDGLASADSYTFNPHKWMFTNFDCNCLFVADKDAIAAALSIMPEYLRNKATESGEVLDYRDWQIPLGRRFRALKLWFTLRHYGAEGIQHHVREHVSIARWLGDEVEEHPDFELAAPVSLNLVCFRHKSGDARSREILTALNDSGQIYMSHTELDGGYAMRLCVGQTHTRREHVERAWELIRSA